MVKYLFFLVLYLVFSLPSDPNKQGPKHRLVKECTLYLLKKREINVKKKGHGVWGKQHTTERAAVWPLRGKAKDRAKESYADTQQANFITLFLNNNLAVRRKLLEPKAPLL